MTKSERFQRAKKYYEYFENLVRQNKKSKKKIFGHTAFAYINNVPASIVTFEIAYLGLTFILTILAKIPLRFAMPFISIPSILVSFAQSLALKPIIEKTKGKLSLGFAKLEFYSICEEKLKFYKKYYKNIFNTQNFDQVSEEDITKITDKFAVDVDNIKNSIWGYIGHSIYQKNEKDYKKIEKLYDTITNKNKEKVTKKIEKIIVKNNKITKPWCDLYNELGQIVKEIYNTVSKVNDDVEIPDDDELTYDYQELNRNVQENFDLDSCILCTEQKDLDLDFERADQNVARDIAKMRNELQNKKEQHIEEL